MTALQLQLNYHTVPLYFKPKSFCLSGKTPVLSFMSSFRDLTVSVGDKFCIAYSFPLHFIVTQSSSTVSLLTAMLFVVKNRPGEIGCYSRVSGKFSRARRKRKPVRIGACKNNAPKKTPILGCKSFTNENPALRRSIEST